VYPVTYEADYQKERNRLTTFFRLIVAIPWILVAYVYMLAQTVVVIVAWFALVLLGRYPEGMYDFVGGILRFYMRVTAFLTLQTDAWPSFGISDERDYPVRINFAPPAARQSRLKAFFRIFLVIPLLIMTYVFGTLQQIVAVLSWFTIVFRGYQPAGAHNALAFSNSWYTRAYAYMLLMRDEYPPVGDEVPVEVHPPAAALPPGGDSPAAIGSPPAAGIAEAPPAAELTPPAEQDTLPGAPPAPDPGEDPPRQTPPAPPTAG
jgi:hypothetical protein